MRWVSVIAAFLIIPAIGFAGVVRLGWDYDQPDHRGFRIYYGTASNIAAKRATNPFPDPTPYESVITILDPNTRTYEVTLPDGTYYFRMVAIGKNGDSDFTAEEPMAFVGVDIPENFRIEWIFVKPEAKRSE